MSRGFGWCAGWVVLIASAAFVTYLFYFRGYVAYLSSESSSFPVELARAEARVHRDARILVLGNSTAAEGFLPNYFNARAGGEVALNLGISGGSVYLFDRMVAMAAREGIRPRAIVLMLTPETGSDNPTVDFMVNDLTMLKTIVTGRDLVTLAGYSEDPIEYASLAGPVALRPALFRAELRDFVERPIARIENARRTTAYLREIRHDAPMPEVKNRFAVCDAGALEALPATIEQARREHNPELADMERVERGYDVLRRQQLKLDAFHMERLKHLLQKLAATHASVYIALSPLFDPKGDQFPQAYRQEFETSLEGIARGISGVTLLPRFESDCSMMADTIHLNRKGAEMFAEYLRGHIL